MYQCTDCNEIYKEKPEYCECGNDQFTEIADSELPTVKLETKRNAAAVKLQKKIKKVKKQRKIRIKNNLSKEDVAGYAVFSVCIALSVLVLLFMDTGQSTSSKKGEKTAQTKKINIPTNIDYIWNSEPPTTKPIDPASILNTKLLSIDPTLTSYLDNLTSLINMTWNKNEVMGNGTYLYEFSIDRYGNLTNKKLYKPSGNKSLDASASKFTSILTKVPTPPETYNEETIIVAFKSVDGIAGAFIPNIKTK